VNPGSACVRTVADAPERAKSGFWTGVASPA
jgi:hypothetical protein